MKGRFVYGNKGIGECNGHRECDDCKLKMNMKRAKRMCRVFIFKVRVIYVEILGNLTRALIVLSATGTTSIN